MRTISSRVLAIALVALAGCGSDTDTDARRASPGDSRQAPATYGPAEGSEFCPFAPVRPTYLPWLRARDAVPRPQESYGPDEDSDDADLYWFREGSGPYYVGLKRKTEFHGSGPGKPVSVRIDGAGGELYESVGPSHMAIIWDTGADRCNYIVLDLDTSGELIRSDAEAEILKVAESLRPVE